MNADERWLCERLGLKSILKPKHREAGLSITLGTIVGPEPDEVYLNRNDDVMATWPISDISTEELVEEADALIAED